MSKENIEKNDIVQITDAEHPWFPCLLVVDEVRAWGVQAYCLVPHRNDENNVGAAYNRLKTGTYEYVGAVVIAESEPEMTE